MNKGQTGTITWGDGKTSKVEVVDVESYSVMPTDYWFKYRDEETYRPLIHPDFGKEDYIKSEILLPEGLVDLVFTKDE